MQRWLNIISIHRRTKASRLPKPATEVPHFFFMKQFNFQNDRLAEDRAGMPGSIRFA
jgi:hypothetical protein